MSLREFETRGDLIHRKSVSGSAFSEDTAVHSVSLSMPGVTVQLAAVLWLLEEGNNYIRHLIIISSRNPVVNNLNFFLCHSALSNAIKSC